MKVTIPQTVWLSNPARAIDLAPDNPQRFRDRISLYDPALDMEDMGWVRLGSATIFVTIEVTSQKIVSASVLALKEKLREMDVEHERNRQKMLDVIGKLSALEWDGGRIKS